MISLLRANPSDTLVDGKYSFVCTYATSNPVIPRQSCALPSGKRLEHSTSSDRAYAYIVSGQDHRQRRRGTPSSCYMRIIGEYCTQISYTGSLWVYEHESLKQAWQGCWEELRHGFDNAGTRKNQLLCHSTIEARTCCIEVSTLLRNSRKYDEAQTRHGKRWKTKSGIQSTQHLLAPHQAACLSLAVGLDSDNCHCRCEYTVAWITRTATINGKAITAFDLSTVRHKRITFAVGTIG